MNILVVNAGSSSLKYQLLDMKDEKLLCKGQVERIGMGHPKISQTAGSKKIDRSVDYVADHQAALTHVFALLTDAEFGAINDISEIKAIGHRVLHTGEDFNGSVKITKDVIKTLEKNIPLGPLHMPANISCIKACQTLLPATPMVAVFDTAFHMTMPRYAYMYGIPYEDYEKYKVRRYGFHGTSHKYVSEKAVRIVDKTDSKIVTCHLGNGSSIAAVRDGKCVDTSMGLTPLEGLLMGTRSGDIDPMCIEYLMGKKNLDIHEMMEYLNKKSGFLGVSGVSSDSRDVIAEMNAGNERAKLAFDMFAYRVKKYIGAYAAAMGGLDAIVFTGGIGENSSASREAIMKDMEFLGVDFDFEKNKIYSGKGEDALLNKESSKVKVLLIPTNEELVIARETKELI